MDKVGKSIKALRLSHGLKGAELARRLGITQPSLWELENRPGAEPSGRVLARMCQELHTTATYIMLGADTADGLEAEQEAAEILYVYRNASAEGRKLLLTVARGLLSGSSLVNGYTKQSPPVT